MKKIIALLALTMSLASANSQSIYQANSAQITFFSKTPVEDIDATNKQVTSILNTATNDIVFFVPMKGFKFPKDLMEEHFNEKYVESEKFPKATFKGKINEKIDFSKDGVYEVSTTGTLTIHGVEKQRTDKGTLTIKNGVISITCSMKVTLKDHKIEVPSLVGNNIAETMDVKIIASYIPYKK